MKLFLDANVLFTAVYSPRGRARGLFELADAGHCSLCTSAFALEEARRNLAMKAPAKLSGLGRILPLLTIVPEPSPEKVTWAKGLPLPMKDAPIMAAAVVCAADILATGDRHDFGHLFGQSSERVGVMSPMEALGEVLKGIR
jgi:predicted nucleic acid-binding protein